MPKNTLLRRNKPLEKLSSMCVFSRISVKPIPIDEYLIQHSNRFPPEEEYVSAADWKEALSTLEHEGYGVSPRRSKK